MDCSIVLEGTVPTGLEIPAAGEIKEKLNLKTVIERGHVFFEISSSDHVLQALKLRCLDNLFVRLRREKVELNSKDTTESLAALRQFIPTVHSWKLALQVWQTVFGQLPGGLEKSLDSMEKYLNGIQIENQEEPSFRVTCIRTGQKHHFTSQEAAIDFGGHVQEHLKWKVKMKNSDVEVVLRITDNDVSVSLALTKQSLFVRNIVKCGATTLRSTIAHGLLRMAKLQPGEILCDPMCGSGAIPIEAALEFPNITIIAGDNSPVALDYSAQNLEQTTQKFLSPFTLFCWDCTRLPLRSESVDCIVTDMPFGKRMGSRYQNRDLYPRVLSELARITNAQTGRAIILTQDKVNMTRALKLVTHWKQTTIQNINVGGLVAAAFVLKRTIVL